MWGVHNISLAVSTWYFLAQFNGVYADTSPSTNRMISSSMSWLVPPMVPNSGRCRVLNQKYRCMKVHSNRSTHRNPVKSPQLVDLQASKRISRVAFIHAPLYAQSSPSDSDIDGTILNNDRESIENLYKLAMEEDEEWFNTFIKDTLDENDTDTQSHTPPQSVIEEQRTQRVTTKVTTKKEDMVDKIWNVSKSKSLSSLDVSSQELNNKAMNDTSSVVQVSSIVNDNTTTTLKTTESNNSLGNNAMGKIRDTRDEEEKLRLDAKINIPVQKKESVGAKEKDDEMTKDDYADLIVEFQDVYDPSNWVQEPFARFQYLGYQPKDILSLRPNALDFILEDNIPKPDKGLPQRWLQSKDNNEEDARLKPLVRILKRRKKTMESSSSKSTLKDNVDEEIRKKDLKRRLASVQEEETTTLDDEDDSFISNPMKKKIRNQRLERLRDYTSPDDISSSSNTRQNKFWMDLPTFKKYLRKEAQLRLSILGSDWKDWVRGESDWRYQLYKTWLEVLDGGIGDDMFEDVPSSTRSKYVRTTYRKRDVSNLSRDDGYRKTGEKNTNRDTKQQNGTRRKEEDDFMPPPRMRQDNDTFSGLDDDLDDDEEEYNDRPKRRRRDPRPRRSRDDN